MPTVHVKKTGSDSNSYVQAQSESTPWLTIQKAVDTVVAGDTILVYDGTYAENIVLGVSGTAGNYITLTFAPGNTPVLSKQAGPSTRMVYGNGATGTPISYYKIIGLTFSDYDSEGIVFHGFFEYIEIRDNIFTNQIFQTGGGHAILFDTTSWTIEFGTDNIYNPSHHVIIDNNTFTNIAVGPEDGSKQYDECLTVAFNCSYVQITNNTINNSSNIGIDTIGKGPDFYPQVPHGEIAPQYVLVKGNTIYNSGLYGEDSALYGEGVKDAVWEDNLVYDHTGVGITMSSEFSIHARRCIVRRNRIINTKNGMIIGSNSGVPWDLENSAFVHNTVYNDAGEATTINFPINYNDPGTVIAKNNVSAFNNSPELVAFHLTQSPGRIAYPTMDYNYYFPAKASVYYWELDSGARYYDTLAGYQGQSGEDANAIAPAAGTVAIGDLFTDAPNYDLTYAGSSPLLNAGGDLTTTTNSGSSATAVNVVDVRYFSDGMTMQEGDAINVGGSVTTVTAVTWGTGFAGTLTVSPAISWSSSDPVNYVYNGSAPDMGWYTFAGASASAPVNTLPATFSTNINTDDPIPGIMVADADNDALDVYLTVTAGTLTATETGTGTIKVA